MTKITRTAALTTMMMTIIILFLSPANALIHRNELQLTDEERILLELEQWADIEMEKYQKVRGILPIRHQAVHVQEDEEDRIAKGLRGVTR